MIENEDHIAMAAEYVLGTLDGDERVQVETMMNVDQDFKALVESWERRLGELHAMVAAIEPPPEIWGKVRTAVSAIAPSAALRLPELSTPTPVAAVGPIPSVVSETAEIVSLSSRARRWRTWAQTTTALSASLVGLIGVQAYPPGLLAETLRPKAASVA